MNQPINRVYLRISLLAAIFVAQFNTIASVIMVDLMELFPDASPTAIQMVMQFGMIGAFPVSLAVGFLSQKFRIKPMVCIGLIAIAVGGALPFPFHNSLVQLYISAVIIGAGQGFLEPLINTLTLRHFEGQPRARQIGLNNTVVTGGATIVTMLAGVVALQGWLNIFYIYLLAIPAFIAVLIFMPKGEKPVPAPKTEKVRVPVPARAFVQAVILIIGFMSYSIFPLNVGMLVDMKGIGDSSSVGLAMSIITIIGALFGLIFPYIVKAFKTFIFCFATFFGVLGLLLASFASSVTMVYISAVALGFFFGAMGAGAVFLVGRMCSPEQFGPSLSINLSFITIGVVLAPIVVNGITSMWGGEGSVGALVTSAVIMGVTFVASIFWGIYIMKKFPNDDAAPAGEAETSS